MTNAPSDDRRTDTPHFSCWRRAALVVSAGLVSAALAAPASAQQRQEGGRALDANPRSGSGGRNDDAGSIPGRSPLVTGNQIITGNVTGGRQFRDRVGYTDPTAFRDVTSGSFSSDRFVRQSAGVPRSVGGVQTQIDLSRPQAFYGSERVTPPPAGYVPTAGATGGYIAASSTALSNGSTLRARTLNLGLDSTARPGELVLSTLDQSNQQTYLTASPLQGVRMWEAGNDPNAMFGGGGQLLRPGDNPMDRFGSDPNSILRMRDEMNRAAGGNDSRGGQPGQGQQPTGLSQPIDTSIGGRTESNGNNAGNNAPGQNQAAAIRTGAISTEIGATAIGGESGQTNQSLRSQLVLAPADRQTPQLGELRRQYERRQGVRNDVEANHEFALEMRTRKEGEAKAKAQDAQAGPLGRGPGGAGGRKARGAGTDDAGAPTPGAPTPSPAPAPAPATEPAPNTPAPEASPANPVTPAPEVSVPAGPVRIGSMAENVQAKGLRDLLTSAEQLMRQEKYAAALDKYNTAQDVAPNNRLITVGRAHAELAASYYRRAETDLREALAQAPELAEAQFDLKNLVGPERLQVIVKDLKDLAESDKTQPRPLVLLAYIAYHTDNKDQAASYLDAAQQRVQGDDPLIKAWRGAWNLPRGGGRDLNK